MWWTKNVYYFYPTYMRIHFLLFHYISSPIICSQWKSVTSLKTSRKCCKSVKEKTRLFSKCRIPGLFSGPWAQDPSGCLPHLLLPVHPNTAVCPFFPTTDFIPLSVSQKPSAALHRLQDKAQTFRAWIALPPHLSSPPDFVHLHRPSALTNSMSPAPHARAALTCLCTFAHVAFPPSVSITSPTCQSDSDSW